MRERKPVAYNGNSPYIFVSYAHKDNAVVYPFILALQEICNVWFDEGIHYGNEWEEEIAAKLKGCRIFIYMITSNSLASQNCKDEIYLAREKKKHFINVMVDGKTELSDVFLLRYGRYQMCKLDSFGTVEMAVADLVRKSKLMEEVAKDGGTLKAFSREAAEKQIRQTEAQRAAQEDELRAQREAAAAEEAERRAAAEAELMQRHKPAEPATRMEPRGRRERPFDMFKKWIAEVAQEGGTLKTFSRRQAESEPVSRKSRKIASPGRVSAQSPAETAKECRALANLGDAEAQYRLGTMFENGRGVRFNDEEAQKWYQKAAAQGHSDARRALERMARRNAEPPPPPRAAPAVSVTRHREEPEDYFPKRPSGPSPAEMAKQCRVLALEGDAEAQYLLGTMFEKGRGVRFNNEEAKKWYRKAAAQGYAEARRALQRLG